jgi:hypothetical protein
VATKEELAAMVKLLLTKETVRKDKIGTARRLLETQAHVLDDVIETLREKLEGKNRDANGDLPSIESRELLKGQSDKSK